MRKWFKIVFPNLFLATYPFFGHQILSLFLSHSQFKRCPSLLCVWLWLLQHCNIVQWWLLTCESLVWTRKCKYRAANWGAVAFGKVVYKSRSQAKPSQGDLVHGPALSTRATPYFIRLRCIVFANRVTLTVFADAVPRRRMSSSRSAVCCGSSDTQRPTSPRWSARTASRASATRSAWPRRMWRCWFWPTKWAPARWASSVRQSGWRDWRTSSATRYRSSRRRSSTCRTCSTTRTTSKAYTGTRTTLRGTRTSAAWTWTRPRECWSCCWANSGRCSVTSYASSTSPSTKSSTRISGRIS